MPSIFNLVLLEVFCAVVIGFVSFISSKWRLMDWKQHGCYSAKMPECFIKVLHFFIKVLRQEKSNGRIEPCSTVSVFLERSFPVKMPPCYF